MSDILNGEKTVCVHPHRLGGYKHDSLAVCSEAIHSSVSLKTQTEYVEDHMHCRWFVNNDLTNSVVFASLFQWPHILLFHSQLKAFVAGVNICSNCSLLLIV